MKTVFNNTIATALPNSKANHQKIITKRLLFLVSTIFLILISTGCSTDKEIVSFVRPEPKLIETKITPPSFQYEPATLKGIVTDKEGNLLQDVTIYFDQEEVGKTNAKGEFETKSTKRNDKVYSLIAQKEGFNNVVNSYHTKMGAMSYTIQMGKPCKCDSIITDYFCECLKPIQINWTNNFTENESLTLNDIIDCLKRNPDCSVQITYLIGDANKQAATPRIEKVKKYMVNKGISENRIVTFVERNNQNQDNIIFIQKM